MAINFSCTCGRRMAIDEQFAGKQGQCPACNTMMTIPSQGEATAIQAAKPVATKPVAAKVPAWEQPPSYRTAAPAAAAPAHEPDNSVDDFELRTHAGQPLAEDDDFFAEAPRPIGKLFSVFTSLKKHHAPTPAGTRAAIASVLFIVGAVATSFLVGAFMGGRLRPDQVTVVFLCSAGVGAALIGLVYWWTSFSHTCSYVGDNGVAAYRCSGNRENVSQTDFFLFENAVDLRTAQTRHYVNGGYTGTTYAFTWSDQHGRTVYTMSGRYNSQEGNPVASDPFHFALAAEWAWSIFLLRRIDPTRDDLLFFALTGGNYVEIGNGVLNLALGGNIIHLRSDQINKMTIENGIISVWEHGASQGWFSNTGIHQFNYADLGNARFFMIALDHKLGIRF